MGEVEKNFKQPGSSAEAGSGGEVTVLDTTYRANSLTGELIVTGSDMHWRKTLAQHKAETLINRWREVLVKL